MSELSGLNWSWGLSPVISWDSGLGPGVTFSSGSPLPPCLTLESGADFDADFRPLESHALRLTSISFISFSLRLPPVLPPLPLGLPWHARPGGAGDGVLGLLLTLPEPDLLLPLPMLTLTLSRRLSLLDLVPSSLGFSLPSALSTSLSRSAESSIHNPSALFVNVTLMHSTAQYCTVLHYYTVLHITAHYCTVLHGTAQYCTVLNNTAQYCTVLHNIAQYCTLLHITE